MLQRQARRCSREVGDQHGARWQRSCRCQASGSVFAEEPADALQAAQLQLLEHLVIIFLAPRRQGCCALMPGLPHPSNSHGTVVGADGLGEAVEGLGDGNPVLGLGDEGDGEGDDGLGEVGRGEEGLGELGEEGLGEEGRRELGDGEAPLLPGDVPGSHMVEGRCSSPRRHALLAAATDPCTDINEGMCTFKGRPQSFH